MKTFTSEQFDQDFDSKIVGYTDDLGINARPNQIKIDNTVYKYKISGRDRNNRVDKWKFVNAENEADQRPLVIYVE
jgi:hypothetical protein